MWGSIASFITFQVIAWNVKSAMAFSHGFSLTNAMLASTQVSEVDSELSNSVTAGAELAMKECANQFRFDVWNCPATVFNMDKDDMENNRETAFIHAVTSAAVVHTISRNCSEGSLASCGCEHRMARSGSDGWKWGGCSDNLGFGEQISKKFLDTEEFDSKPRSLANLHNNQAGRIALRKSMRKVCKCHGVSGSCVTQTCWRQMGNFNTVGKFLKKQYKRAAKVDLSNGILKKLESHRSNSMEKKSRNMMNSRDKRTSANTKEMKINKRKLVFLQPSPDYCRFNAKLGFKGVLGKTCEVDPESKDQTEQIRKCTNLCNSCGLHVKKQIVDVVSSCNCKFEWCCKISCQTCHKKKILITCSSTPSYNKFLDLGTGTIFPSFPKSRNSI